jgi:leucyl-tRNA synthetase
MMILMNAAEKAPALRRETVETFVRLVAPFAPHVCEEIWARLGHQESVSCAAWPKFDPAKLIETTVEIIFQVNGKVRATVRVPKETTKEALLAMAKADPSVQKFLEGKPIVKEIVVPGRIVNLVVAG